MQSQVGGGSYSPLGNDIISDGAYSSDAGSVSSMPELINSNDEGDGAGNQAPTTPPRSKAAEPSPPATATAIATATATEPGGERRRVGTLGDQTASVSTAVDSNGDGDGDASSSAGSMPGLEDSDSEMPPQTEAAPHGSTAAGGGTNRDAASQQQLGEMAAAEASSQADAATSTTTPAAAAAAAGSPSSSSESSSESEEDDSDYEPEPISLDFFIRELMENEVGISLKSLVKRVSDNSVPIPHTPEHARRTF